jgi:hypothetical protein
LTPQFAVNYAVATADLVRGRKVEFDYFKCPAWPGVIAAARQLLPIYVHFPYNVGLGIANAMDAETNRPVD